MIGAKIGIVAALLLCMAALLTDKAARAQGTASSSDLPADTVERIVRDYLLRHPEIVIEAIEAYKRKREASEEEAVRQAIAENRTKIFNNPDSAVGGNPNGDVTLVEFFDYRCGVCKRVHPIVKELMKRDRGIRRVYKEWPILGPESIFAARAAIAARRQGEDKYLAFHDAMMTSRGALSQETVLKLAAAVGLDTRRLGHDLTRPEVEGVLQRNYALAEALRINGTPSFVIGDSVLRGGRDLDTFLSIVRDARENRKN